MCILLKSCFELFYLLAALLIPRKRVGGMGGAFGNQHETIKLECESFCGLGASSFRVVTKSIFVCHCIEGSFYSLRSHQGVHGPPGCTINQAVFVTARATAAGQSITASLSTPSLHAHTCKTASNRTSAFDGPSAIVCVSTETLETLFSQALATAVTHSRTSLRRSALVDSLLAALESID